MAKQQVEEQVFSIVEEILKDQDVIELVDVEYVRERDWYLRVFIDKAGGIEIDDCQALSERLEKILDEKNLIADSYILEVSSPGLDRQLKKPRDFVREQGKAVDVTLYAPEDGKKEFTGVLEGFDEVAKTVTIDGTAWPLAKLSVIRLHIDF
ncbi:ribosome maturation factor RimP [uncultured Selenomonas sp.]|uniref:ribosome maturation factor RimP n=1 Tax=uncultured Selenomonas sp. TaxID=159275 RepID=UPI0025E5CA13|nr:ribosome maturation factor RimP [uncultured Selenomonas sp.]